MKIIQKIPGLIVLIVLSSQILFSQDSNATKTSYTFIETDFLEDNYFEDIDHLESGTTYVFKINNVNRHLYKITSSTTQTEYNTEIPSVFKDIKLPGILNLEVPEANQFNISVDEHESFKNTIDAILTKISDQKSQMDSIINYDNELTNLIQSCGKSYNSIEKKLIQKTKKTFKAVTSDSRSEQPDQIETQLIAFVNDAIKNEEDLEAEIKKQEIKVDDSIKKNKLSILKEEISQPAKSTDLNSSYAKSVIKINSLKQQNTNYENYLNELKSKVAEAIAVIDVIKAFRTENKTAMLIDKYKLINPANFTYYSEPLTVNKDEVVFSFTATSDELLSCNLQNQKTISKTFKVRGGWKVDFSTGVFFNGGDKDFFGRELYYSTTSETTSTIKAKDGGNRLLLGIGGLMHIYKRSDKAVKWALSPGLSTSTGFDQLNFHLGGSAIFGNKNRIVITAGVTLRESEILDKSFKLDTAYDNVDLPEVPPVIKVFPRFGYFVSLTYNFSKFKD